MDAPALELLPDADAIDRRLDQLAAEEPVAPVAPQAPLLANLSAQENLELIGAFHGKQTAPALAARAAEALASLGVGHCADRRPTELTAHETFMVLLGRAAMRPGALGVLVTPFTQVPELESDTPIFEALAALDRNRFRILDYPSNRSRYTGVTEAGP